MSRAGAIRRVCCAFYLSQIRANSLYSPDLTKSPPHRGASAMRGGLSASIPRGVLGAKVN